MSNIKAIILDDEQLAIDTLIWQINNYCQEINIVGTFTNPLEAQKYIYANPIDLCFLDIDMPEMTGFEFIDLWDITPFDIIFTTAYSEHAIRAFKVSALDYLLKPIDEEELETALEKYTSSFKSPKTQDTNDQIKLLLNQLSNQEAYAERIALPTSEGVHFAHVKDILRLEADKNYTTVYFDEASPILLSKTLKEVEQLLDPERFFRVHQSHTIDLQKISIYHRGTGGSITMTNGDIIPVSKYRKTDLLRLMNI